MTLTGHIGIRQRLPEACKGAAMSCHMLVYPLRQAVLLKDARCEQECMSSFLFVITPARPRGVCQLRCAHVQFVHVSLSRLPLHVMAHQAIGLHSEWKYFMDLSQSRQCPGCRSVPTTVHSHLQLQSQELLSIYLSFPMRYEAAHNPVLLTCCSI